MNNPMEQMMREMKRKAEEAAAQVVVGHLTPAEKANFDALSPLVDKLKSLEEQKSRIDAHFDEQMSKVAHLIQRQKMVAWETVEKRLGLTADICSSLDEDNNDAVTIHRRDAKRLGVPFEEQGMSPLDSHDPATDILNILNGLGGPMGED